jgi:histidinol-phosphate aminotransferase
MKILVRPEIEKVESYNVEDLLEIKTSNIIKLDLNENLIVLNREVKKIIKEAVKEVDFRLYPKPYGKEAAEAIAKFYNLNKEKIFVANGSDDLIDKLSRIFIIPKESNIIINEPTFTIYSFFTRLYGGEKREVLLKPDFQLNIDEILSKCNFKTSMIIICSPNNPTGNQFNINDVEKILKSFDGLVVVDEAYADFGDSSILNLTEKYENLIVLRSFSKSFGLASIRAGFAVADEKVVKYLMKSSGPFLVSSLTQKIIKAALENWSLFKKRIEYVIKERDWLFNKLNEMEEVTAFPSKANFILFKIEKKNLSAELICKKLKFLGVYIKDKSKDPLLEKCLRVTVGNRRMNIKFISELKRILKEAS